MGIGRRHPPALRAGGIADPAVNPVVNPVVIGRVGAPHGVAGALRIVSSTVPAENIEHYRPWLVGDGAQFREVSVCWIKPHGRDFLAGFDGVTDRDAAERLSGLLIATPRSALPALDADGEYYWQDLIGSSVVTAAGRTLGTVARLLETGAHDVLVIAGADEEHLVPFVDAFVIAVDVDARRIVVDWQEPG